MTYNDAREKQYEAEVRRNAFRLGVEIRAENGQSFLVEEGRTRLLCRPDLPKRFWYETWLALKQRYPLLPKFIR